MKISHMQLSCLWPLANNIKNIVSNFKNIIIVEMNDGQLYNLLRVKIAPNAKSITQISGKPFRVKTLIEKFTEINN